MDFFVNEVRVTERQFSKIYNILSMSSLDWEIDRRSNASYIYTF
jgi:hypothetical protein